MSLKLQITEEMKTAMRAGDKSRLATIRLILAAIKQIEVDSRISLDDDDDDNQTLAVLDKMVKQRRESIAQYQKAKRQELVDIEAAEIEIIQTFLPQPLTDGEINDMINAAVEQTGAASIRDMGKVMGILKPQMQGRADMGAVSGMIKARLNA
ncbi:glutamyl-tRNA amidotransferase [Solemya pervernicosa gill symbiont]|uniref:Glutamyl-tRNA amidotransferase n=2 Tax=Gammaproteobacteria incertae sedis TaxID=118884 RepID=A0A1T2L3K2_9GAMM|nr:GatB/YqeY domain-containing protein [Candidatus Reidiella endopervernicosa]OOZ39687.1 glutamyl-tRNA amidotransferase [Solemya pervernicosa gill symbiont]QKQ24978.1 GatB/YqeY domain-containing protein [Candidatus Reidiella endopervernicosa]